jgi:hypothetical protein
MGPPVEMQVHVKMDFAVIGRDNISDRYILLSNGRRIRYWVHEF